VKKNYDDMLSRFHLIPERYGQTDRRTDRIAISISRVSMLTRDEKPQKSDYYNFTGVHIVFVDFLFGLNIFVTPILTIK